MFNRSISSNSYDRLANESWKKESMLKIWNYNIGMMLECEKVSFNGCSPFTKNHHRERIISSFGWFVDLFLFYATARTFQSYNGGQLT